MTETNNQREGYRHGDTLLPRVTDILAVVNKPALIRWLRNNDRETIERQSESSKDHGTIVHEMLASALTSGCNTERCRCGLTDPEMRIYHDHVMGFMDTYVDEVLAVELSLVSPRIGFGGTLDCYVKLLTGELAVVDFKTGKGLYPEYALQTAAYGLLLLEHGYQVDHRLCLLLKRGDEGPPKVQHHTEHQKDVRGFLAALEIYNWRRPDTEPKMHGRLV